MSLLRRLFRRRKRTIPLSLSNAEFAILVEEVLRDVNAALSGTAPPSRPMEDFMWRDLRQFRVELAIALEQLRTDSVPPRRKRPSMSIGRSLVDAGRTENSRPNCSTSMSGTTIGFHSDHGSASDER